MLVLIIITVQRKINRRKVLQRMTLVLLSSFPFIYQLWRFYFSWFPSEHLKKIELQIAYDKPHHHIASRPVTDAVEYIGLCAVCEKCKQGSFPRFVRSSSESAPLDTVSVHRPAAAGGERRISLDPQGLTYRMEFAPHCSLPKLLRG